MGRSGSVLLGMACLFVVPGEVPRALAAQAHASGYASATDHRPLALKGTGGPLAHGGYSDPVTGLTMKVKKILIAPAYAPSTNPCSRPVKQYYVRLTLRVHRKRVTSKSRSLDDELQLVSDRGRVSPTQTIQATKLATGRTLTRDIVFVPLSPRPKSLTLVLRHLKVKSASQGPPPPPGASPSGTLVGPARSIAVYRVKVAGPDPCHSG